MAGNTRLMVSVPVIPMGKPRMTRSDKWNKRPAVVRYRKYCDDLREHLPEYALPGCLRLTFLIPMPKSWSKKERAARLGSPHTQTPDIDNLSKAYMDAFKTDDSHVYALGADKYWSELGSIEVEVEHG